MEYAQTCRPGYNIFRANLRLGVCHYSLPGQRVKTLLKLSYRVYGTDKCYKSELDLMADMMMMTTPE